MKNLLIVFSIIALPAFGMENNDNFIEKPGVVDHALVNDESFLDETVAIISGLKALKDENTPESLGALQNFCDVCSDKKNDIDPENLDILKEVGLILEDNNNVDSKTKEVYQALSNPATKNELEAISAAKKEEQPGEENNQQ